MKAQNNYSSLIIQKAETRSVICKLYWFFSANEMIAFECRHAALRKVSGITFQFVCD